VVEDLRCPDERTPIKFMRQNNFNFVKSIWHTYVKNNRTNLE